MNLNVGKVTLTFKKNDSVKQKHENFTIIQQLLRTRIHWQSTSGRTGTKKYEC